MMIRIPRFSRTEALGPSGRWDGKGAAAGGHGTSLFSLPDTDMSCEWGAYWKEFDSLLLQFEHGGHEGSISPQTYPTDRRCHHGSASSPSSCPHFATAIGSYVAAQTPHDFCSKYKCRITRRRAGRR